MTYVQLFYERTKYFKKHRGQVYLEAANPKYPIIRPKTELRLGGVVTAVIRKYHQ